MIIKSTPIKIEGVAATISQNIVPVVEWCEGLATEKKLRRIIKETGFESLSISDNETCTSDMCFQAAENLFNNGGFNKDDIKALIFISEMSDYVAPATAFILQDRLKLNKNLIAFDINLGCSGFINGVYVASSLLSSFEDNAKVLICCGNVEPHKIKAPNINSGVIFGDAGACAIVSRNDNEKFTLFNIDSYGERWNKLFRNNGTRHFKKVLAEQVERCELVVPYFMDGAAIMDFTLFEVVDNIEELIQAAQISKEDIGAYLFHQPQKMLVNDMSEKLGLNPKTVIQNAQHIGNTNSASIPLLLTEIGADWNNRANKKVLMSGFGVGLSVASTILDLNDLVCMETQKYEGSNI